MEQDHLKSNSSVARALGIRSFLIAPAIFAALSLLAPLAARADGIDVVWLVTRVGGWSAHPILSAVIMIGLMLINYLLNVVVIGMPSARSLHIKLGALLRDLAVFTLLAQTADRVGAVTGFLISFFFIDRAGLGAEQALKVGSLLGVALNFILSGLGVGLLALWYLRRRWGVEKRRAMAIMAGAVLITNPAWVMLPWFIFW